MLNFLDRLRAKPPHFRRAVALIVVTVIVGLIFVMWIMTLLPKIGNSEISQSGNENSSEGTPRPFSALTEQVRRLYENGAQVLIDFTEFGEPIEYVQEKKLPDNLSRTLEDTAEEGSF